MNRTPSSHQRPADRTVSPPPSYPVPPGTAPLVRPLSASLRRQSRPDDRLSPCLYPARQLHAPWFLRLPSESLPGFVCVAKLLSVRLGNALTSLVVRFASLTDLLTGPRSRNAEKIEGYTCPGRPRASLCPPPPRLSDLLFVRHGSALTSLVFRFGSLIGLLTELRIQNAEKIEGCTCFLDVLVPPHALLPLTASHL